MKYLDINGLVKFSSANAERAYRQAEAYLSNSEETSSAMQAVDALSGTQEPTLVVTTSMDPQNLDYNANTNTITCNPSTGGDVSGQGGHPNAQGQFVQSPALILFHEVVHTVQAQLDTDKY
ncbi:MAG: hypothetical protein ACREP9_10695, partial [Candidatus Dormibacteraceae bacterium]